MGVEYVYPCIPLQYVVEEREIIWMEILLFFSGELIDIYSRGTSAVTEFQTVYSIG